MIKHVVMFSGGAASSVMAKIVADKYPGDTILLHTPTGAEHEDADRFRAQVANYIGCLSLTSEPTKHDG
jgi:3'-phosphoadenosine 5'-phosphosulfate sulfotransferase (PAPS reductase)/FAD synthetase